MNSEFNRIAQQFRDDLKSGKEETRNQLDELRKQIELNEKLFKLVNKQQESLLNQTKDMKKRCDDLSNAIQKLTNQEDQKPYLPICPAESRKPVLENPFKHNPNWNECKEAVAKNGLYLQHVPVKLRDDYIICKIAFYQNRECIKFMDDYMAQIILQEDDPEFVIPDYY